MPEPMSEARLAEIEAVVGAMDSGLQPDLLALIAEIRRLRDTADINAHVEAMVHAGRVVYGDPLP